LKWVFILKKVFSLFLSCALMLCILTACGESSDGQSEASGSETSGSGLDLSVEDICYAESGIPGDTVLFTVDGEDVTADLFFYWLGYNVSYYDYYYQNYYGMEFDLSENSADLIDMTAQLASQVVLMQPKVKEMGYSPSEEEIQAVYDDIDEMREEYGGDEIFQEMLKEMCLTEEVYTDLSISSLYSELLEEKAYEGHPDSDELKTYIEDNDLMYMKHILLLTVDDDYEPMSDEEKAEQYAKAEDILAQLKSSDDLEATFDELMNEYSEDTGLASYPDGYLFTAGEMVEPVEDAVRGLEYGQISDIVEYDGTADGSYSGYHIILRLDPADYPDIDEYWISDQMNDLIDGWLADAEYKYSDEYNDIDVESFYEKYMEYAEAYADDIEQRQSEMSDSTETEED
ncbi:MAG: peptidylprolyl isomerase, partial [Bacteroidales bacterium]|nr:peptidylprolyl isomerase [Bacteroidales bacterium]